MLIMYSRFSVRLHDRFENLKRCCRVGSNKRGIRIYGQGNCPLDYQICISVRAYISCDLQKSK